MQPFGCRPLMTPSRRQKWLYILPVVQANVTFVRSGHHTGLPDLHSPSKSMSRLRDTQSPLCSGYNAAGRSRREVQSIAQKMLLKYTHASRHETVITCAFGGVRHQ